MTENMDDDQKASADKFKWCLCLNACSRQAASADNGKRACKAIRQSCPLCSPEMRVLARIDGDRWRAGATRSLWKNNRAEDRPTLHASRCVVVRNHDTTPSLLVLHPTDWPFPAAVHSEHASAPNCLRRCLLFNLCYPHQAWRSSSSLIVHQFAHSLSDVCQPSNYRTIQHANRSLQNITCSGH